MKKKNMGLIITIVVLVVLLIGLGGYVCYDKFYLDKKDNNESKNQTIELVKGNSFNLDSITCVNDNNTCSKSLSVSYNNKNHNVKLVKKLVNNTKYVIDLYIDNTLVDSIDGGIFYDWGDGFKAQDWINDLDGYIYVVDSKYLAIVSRKDDAKPSWYLRYYNDIVKVDMQPIEVASSGNSLSVDGKELSDVNSIVFDGNIITYWKEYCGTTEKAIDNDHIVVEQHYVSFDGNKVNDSIKSYIKNAEGGGASVCGIQE